VVTAGIIPPFIPSHTVVYPPTTSPAQRFVPFIASVTSVHAPVLHSLGFRAPFISSHTVVYTPSLQGTFIDVPFISSNTILHPPTLRVTFTGGGVSQVVLEVITSGGVPNAQVTQVTLEIIVPMYKGLHVWQRT
jgi:hypothetical protein